VAGKYGKPKSPSPQHGVPDKQGPMVPSLDGRNGDFLQAVKKVSPNQKLVALVRALGRKAAREWLKNRCGDPG
jgi:hypothetical protein